MGIYSAKFALESAIKAEDLIQSPKDIGNDLDEIEKAVAGPDGLESHRDEIEDAQSGVVGEPLEEAADFFFESEYNYNMIMHTIGIHEMRAASMGRDLVLEAADKAGFFARVKEWLKTMFAKVVKLFNTVIAKISNTVRSEKSFIAKHKEAILAGANTDWKAKGYIFSVNGYNIDKGSMFAPTKWEDVKSEGVYRDDLGNINKTILDNLSPSGKSATSVKDLKDAWFAELRSGASEPVEIDKSKISGQDVINTLSNEDDIKKIKEVYAEIKKSYDESLKQIATLEKNFANKYKEAHKDDKENTSIDTDKSFVAVEYFTSFIKVEKQVQHAVYTEFLAAAKNNRSQAKKLAVKFIGIAKSEGKAKEDKAEPVGESSIFGNLRFV